MTTVETFIPVCEPDWFDQLAIPSRRHVVMFSSGAGSWAAAKRVAAEHGTDDLYLVFADVKGNNDNPHLGEDEDNYRFLVESAKNVGGELIWLKEGRDIWTVFQDNRFLGNSRLANCSKFLKQQPSRGWLDANCDSTDTTVYVGIDWSEIHRLPVIAKNYLPFQAVAPMCDPPYMDKDQVLAWMRSEGLEPPRLYGMGFAHANCGGFCVRAGQAHFKQLLDVMPERFAYHEGREQDLREFLGKDVSVLRDRTGGKSRPLTLRAFRERVQGKAQIDEFDVGGCGCFVDDAQLPQDEVEMFFPVCEPDWFDQIMVPVDSGITTDRHRVMVGNCLDLMRELPDCSVDSVVTDPPYGLEFMGKEWDSFNTRPDGRTQTDTWGKATTAIPGSVYASTLPRFTGKQGASLKPFQDWCEVWARECLRVLKPGGHLLAFGGTRTWHRLVCAVEDAGFEIRDSIAWLYGSGFPKSLDVSKAIDKAARGVPQGSTDPTSPNHGKYRTTTTEGKRWEGDSGQGYGAGGSRFLADTASAKNPQPNSVTLVDTVPTSTLDVTATEWHGWGTALKPAFEPIIVARKPLIGTVAANVLTFGTGALNIDATRIGGTPSPSVSRRTSSSGNNGATALESTARGEMRTRTSPERFAEQRAGEQLGRWPANVILDESQAESLDEQSGTSASRIGKPRNSKLPGDGWGMTATGAEYADTGGASRFFFVAKREGDMLDPCESASIAADRSTSGGSAVPATSGTTPASKAPGDQVLPIENLDSRFNYCAKAPQKERPKVDGVGHPTCKPLTLMRYLVKLVTPPDGTVLDPFLGSGTTGEAAELEGFRSIGFEREDDYMKLIEQRYRKAGIIT